MGHPSGWAPKHRRTLPFQFRVRSWCLRRHTTCRFLARNIHIIFEVKWIYAAVKNPPLSSFELNSSLLVTFFFNEKKSRFWFTVLPEFDVESVGPLV
jgi:hypothetical protein